MLDRFDDRTLEIATVVVVVMIALVILCYLSIFINPGAPWNPFKPPATPTEVAQEGSRVPPTWTWTPTPTPSDTPTPTGTWTPTPTPTDTATPTPLPPTDTPTATPTNTRAPAPPPRPTKPPPTPTPWPYDYEEAGARPNCEWTGVWGYVADASGLAEPNVKMRVGNDQGWKFDTLTDENGWYAVEFSRQPKAGTWFVRVFKGDQPRSMQFWFRTSAGCDGPYSLQEFRIDWRHR